MAACINIRPSWPPPNIPSLKLLLKAFMVIGYNYTFQHASYNKTYETYFELTYKFDLLTAVIAFELNKSPEDRGWKAF